MANTLKGKLTPKNNMKGSLNNEGRLTGQLGGVGAAVTYASLPDKPSINGVTLVGNKTTSDLNINYNDLKNLPVIPDVGEIDERLDDLEGDITSLSGRVTTAEGNITTLQGDTGALNTRLTTAEGNITTLQGDTGALNTRLTTAEGDITSLSGRVTTAEGNITSLDGRVTTNEGNITSLDGRVTTNEGNISNLQDDMTQAQGNITQLNSSMIQYRMVQINITSQVVRPQVGATLLNDVDFTTSTMLDALSNKTLAQLFNGKTILGAHFMWTNGSGSAAVNENVYNNKVTIGVMNVSSIQLAYSAVRVAIWYR